MLLSADLPVEHLQELELATVFNIKAFKAQLNKEDSFPEPELADDLKIALAYCELKLTVIKNLLSPQEQCENSLHRLQLSLPTLATVS